MPTGTDGSPALLLFVDTCSLLDIVRAPHRQSMRGHLVRDARAVHSAAFDEPGRLQIAVCDMVATEFWTNLDGVALDTRTTLRNLHNRVVQANEAAHALALPLTMVPEEMSSDGLSEGVVRLAKTLLANALQVDRSDEDVMRAFGRVAERVAPARQGASSSADCVIVECALRVARSRGDSETWFMSSNTVDFCRDGQLHPDLVEEFADAGLEFVRSWGEARERLGLASG